MSAKLVSIIGAPASGKTLLAERLAVELPAQLIREDYAGNPFLAESYAGSPEARLPSQLYFLMSRIRQLHKEGWAREGLFVSDYGFCQDAIFASQLLGESDLAVYRRVSKGAEDLVQSPNAVISLDASIESLLERIAERGRDFETSMTREFLELMRAEYSAIQTRVHCPVITIDTDAVDIRRREVRSELISELREKL